jgi:hypothetical protein
LTSPLVCGIIVDERKGIQVRFTAEEERQIAAFMKMGDTREEAEAAILEDRADVETEEMKAMAEGAKQNGSLKTGTHSVDAYGRKRTRERKPNEDKRLIIDCLKDTLADFDNCEIVNAERQIDFHLNGVHYSVTLTAHRPPKGKA